MIGSFEAAALSPDQQDMIREFVGRRGGTPADDGRPARARRRRLGRHERRRGAARAAAVVEAPTFERNPAKADSPRSADVRVTRLEPNEAKNVESWSEMPELADFQHIGD